jgi:hypothetical protein
MLTIRDVAGSCSHEILVFRGEPRPLLGEFDDMRAHRFGPGVYSHTKAGLGIRQIFGNVIHRQPH